MNKPERLFIRGKIGVGIEPRFLRLLKEIRREGDSCFPKDIKFLTPYLYETWFDNTDYKFAKEYFTEHGDITAGMCSGVRKGNFFGRNYDWVYSEDAEFIVHTPRIAGRFASIGISSTIPTLTADFVESGEYSQMYKLIPFRLMDGINEYGVIVSTNVVPMDHGSNTTIPLIEKKDSISTAMLVRFILDNFKSAESAVNYIRDYVEIFHSKSVHSKNYEQHFLVCDKNNSYIIEFINNQTKILDVNDHPYMTNFYLSDVILNEDGSVFTPQTSDEEHNPVDTNNITPYGAGLERYNTIVEKYQTIGESQEDMMQLMQSLKYTNSYLSSEKPEDFRIWYSEYIEPEFNLNLKSPLTKLYNFGEVLDEYYVNRDRNPSSKYYGSWQTMHTSIYDIENRSLYIAVQEDYNNSFSFILQVDPTTEALPDPQGSEDGSALIVKDNAWNILSGNGGILPLEKHELIFDDAKRLTLNQELYEETLTFINNEDIDDWGLPNVNITYPNILLFKANSQSDIDLSSVDSIKFIGHGYTKWYETDGSRYRSVAIDLYNSYLSDNGYNNTSIRFAVVSTSGSDDIPVPENTKVEFLDGSYITISNNIIAGYYIVKNFDIDITEDSNYEISEINIRRTIRIDSKILPIDIPIEDRKEYFNTDTVEGALTELGETVEPLSDIEEVQELGLESVCEIGLEDLVEIGVDTVPTEGSENPISSDAVYTGLLGKVDKYFGEEFHDKYLSISEDGFIIPKEIPGSGTTDHAQLENRDAADQHPMSAITGLESALADKLDNDEIADWAKAPQKPAYTAEEVGALPSDTPIPDSYSKTESDLKYAEKDSNASENEIAIFDENGNPKGSGHTLDEYVKYGSLIVTCLTQDGVIVTGQTVTVRKGSDASGTIYAQVAYNGQPVSILVPIGFDYFVSVSDTLDHHFNPTVAYGVVSTPTINITLTYTDLSNINTFGDIKNALNAGVDLSDLVGETITTTRQGEELVFDIVDYDETEKAVTLLLHDTMPDQMIFEQKQALAYFADGLSAGSYYFTDADSSKNYYFTLTKPIPEGGQIRATTSTFSTFVNQDASTALESGSVSETEIAGATSLGTTATGNLNHMDRVGHGSNNAGESGLFAWLNSDALPNTNLPRINKFSRPYSSGADGGFLNGFDADDLACVADTTWIVKANNAYEAPASMGGIAVKGQTYTFTGKFGLALFINIGLSGNDPWDLYVGAENTDRIKYYNSEARNWWTFDANTSGVRHVYNIISSGGSSVNNSDNSGGVVPCCKIVKDN